MPRPKCEFDPETHIYRIDGWVVPSVTQVIDGVLGKPFYAQSSEWHRERGTQIHRAARMLAEGKNFKVDPQIEGYADALRRWWWAVRPSPIDIEWTAYSTIHRFGGTIDLVARICDRLILVDYKTGSLDIDRLNLQLGGYGILKAVDGGIGLELREDGTFAQTNVIKLARHKQEFLAMRTVWGIKERMGLHEQ